MIGVLSLQGLKNSTAVAVITPVIILGVPILDTAVAIVRRKLSGKRFLKLIRCTCITDCYLWDLHIEEQF